MQWEAEHGPSHLDMEEEEKVWQNTGQNTARFCAIQQHSPSLWAPAEPQALVQGSLCLSLISGGICIPRCSPCPSWWLACSRLGLERSFPILCCALEKSLFHKYFFHGVFLARRVDLGCAGRFPAAGARRPSPAQSQGAAHKGDLSKLINTTRSRLLEIICPQLPALQT